MSGWRLMVVALTALMAMLFAANAEDYPTHNVTILVPFAPGGTDLLARAYAQILEKKYGKTFVVESRPAAVRRSPRRPRPMRRRTATR
jgi:tripartite-type tricarboxylate transporter receptor subunit TctC